MIARRHYRRGRQDASFEVLEGDRARVTGSLHFTTVSALLTAGVEAINGGRVAVIDLGGVKLARRKVADLDKDALRSLADSLKSQIKRGVVVLASANDGKVQVVVAVTPDLIGQLKAGQIVKEIAPIVGGGGGGRPDFAEAGGRHPEKIDEMLDASRRVVEAMLAKG